MQVWNVMHAACWKIQDAKNRQKFPIWAQSHTLSGYIFVTKARIDNRKKLSNSNISPTCPYNMVIFGLLAAQIVSLLWGTMANFNEFRVLAPLLHGTLVVGVSETLRRWTEGATNIRQGGHHAGNSSSFFFLFFPRLMSAVADWMSTILPHMVWP